MLSTTYSSALKASRQLYFYLWWNNMHVFWAPHFSFFSFFYTSKCEHSK